MLDKQRGYWHSAELLTAARMAEAGMIVSVPLLPVRYDLIGDHHRLGLIRVQVKRAKWRGQRTKPQGLGDRAAYIVSLTRQTKHKGQIKVPSHVTIEEKEFDYLAVMCTFQDVYFIPVSALRSPENGGRLIRLLQIKLPDSSNTRADAQASGQRWEPYRNKFDLDSDFPNPYG